MRRRMGHADAAQLIHLKGDVSEMSVVLRTRQKGKSDVKTEFTGVPYDIGKNAMATIEHRLRPTLLRNSERENRTFGSHF